MDVRRRPGGRSARVQLAVLKATLDLLLENGYERLSFQFIAERAGVHETSLYRRWKSKEQLVIDAISNQVANDVPIPDTGALRSDLIQLLEYLRLFLQSPSGRVIVQLAIVSRHTPEICTWHEAYWRDRRAQLLRPLFERAIHRGELAADTDLQLVCEMLMGALYVRAFVLNQSLDETLPESIVNLLYSGLPLQTNT